MERFQIMSQTYDSITNYYPPDVSYVKLVCAGIHIHDTEQGDLGLFIATRSIGIYGCKDSYSVARDDLKG